MTTPSEKAMELHTIFERVAGLVPEIRPKKAPESVGGLYWDAVTGDWKYPHGSAPGSAVAILMLTFRNEAEDRIIAACVKWLIHNVKDGLPGIEYWPSNLHDDYDAGYCVDERTRFDGASGPTLAITLLLAVEAAGKDKR